jgi:phage shock protein A
MALITRISRLLKADLHAVLDCIEEPDALLKQSIREMEEVLTEDEQTIQRLSQQHQQLKQRETDCQQSLNTIEEQLDICFNAQQNDLARLQIKRKLELQQLAKRLSRDHVAMQEKLEKSTTELEAKRLQLNSLRQQAEILSKGNSFDIADNHQQTQHCEVRDEDIEVAFLREQQIRSQS